MKIIIVGEGKVGLTLAKKLSSENHDVTVIDQNHQVLSESLEELDILTVVGNGISLETLKEANAEESDLLIAVTNADEVNLLCCLSAKKLGCKSTIARVRNPEYFKQAMFLKEELGLSMAVNPDFAAAQEIFRIIQFPSFLKRDSFVKGRVELVELQIAPGSLLDGKKISDASSVLGLRVLVCAVERDTTLTIPKGGFVLKAKDRITVTAARTDLVKLIKRLDIVQQKIRNAMIIGCGRITKYLADELIKSGVSVKLVDKSPAVCEDFSLKFPDAMIINGDASKRSFLESEGVKNSDAVITLTDIDEENLIISMFCSHMGVSKTVTKVDRNEYTQLFADRGLGSVVCPKELTAGEIIRYVRAMENSNGKDAVKTLHQIVNSKAEALEFTVTETAPFTGVPLSKLRLQSDVLISCIGRNGQIIIPKGDDSINPGDTIIAVTAADKNIGEISDLFEKDAY